MLNLKIPLFYFRLPENVADALRNTIIVLLPIILLYSSYRQAGIGIGIGALLISLTDLPGNRRHKALTAMQSLVIFFIVCLVFSACLSTSVAAGIAIVAFTFVLSMTAAMGGRSAVAGTMGIVLMVFTLGLHPKDPWLFSVFIITGGVWFYMISLLQVLIWPYRSLHQALREALSATSDFLKAKAACYDPAIPLDEAYRQTIALHLRVSEKQELVRQLLLSDRRNTNKLLGTAIRVIGLYEQVTAMHYDYAVVRARLAHTGALRLSAQLITLLSAEVKILSHVVPLPVKLNLDRNYDQFVELNDQLSAIADDLVKEDAAVINGILVNTAAIRRLSTQIAANKELGTEVLLEPGVFLPDGGSYFSKFITHLNFRSPVLRFSLRLTLLFAIGYGITLLFATDQYSYWLLLTIVIVARPKLALTWKRNLERLSGTFAGVLIASLLLFVIKPTVVLLVIAALGLLCFFAWNRYIYAWSVTGITICVVICLSLYHGHQTAIVSARVWYSLAGCILAFAGIFIFPVWTNKELDALAHLVVDGNRLFLEAVVADKPMQDIWLARKEAHLRLAKLSEGLRHARVEPGKVNLPKFEHIQVLNYRINAVIISLFLAPRPTSVADTQKALTHLEHYNQPDRPVLSSQASDNLLKGVDLLDALVCELLLLR